MKKVYISPSLRTINVQIGNVMASVSGGGGNHDVDHNLEFQEGNEPPQGGTNARFFDGGYGCADEKLDW